MADQEEKVHPALRISQLDASELDVALFSLLKDQLNTAFKYFNGAWLSRYGPEVNAGLRWIVWKFTVSARESTIGQQLLDIRYRNNYKLPDTSTPWMTRKQKLLFAFLTLGGPYLSERSTELANYTKNIPHADKFWSLMKKCQEIWKILSLINFLIFINGGQYQVLIERILGIQAVYPRIQGLRQVGFEYMTREMLWHGFAEFLFFLLPLINFRRIRNYASRLLWNPQKDASQMRDEGDLRVCVICEEWPCLPTQIGCPHVFCHYCIHANMKADPKYRCPVCGSEVIDVEPVVITSSIKSKEL